MTNKPSPEETALWQRRLAAQANNHAWSLADQDTRTADEDEDMLQAAHAAMYFWKISGNARNHAHAAQLLAHVYALLRLPNPAQYYHAKSSRFFESAENAPWETAFVHVVAANVAYAAGQLATHRDSYSKAVQAIHNLADAEDQKILNATLRAIPKPAE